MNMFHGRRRVPTVTKKSPWKEDNAYPDEHVPWQEEGAYSNEKITVEGRQCLP
jgi:hypothetical protein